MVIEILINRKIFILFRFAKDQTDVAEDPVVNKSMKQRIKSAVKC